MFMKMTPLEVVAILAMGIATMHLQSRDRDGGRPPFSATMASGVERPSGERVQADQFVAGLVPITHR
jgi:hypothetical protein